MKEMNIAYLSSAYLAPVEYYTKLLAYDKVFVEQYDHYIKQTYRNRCTIAGPSGELALSIPTVNPAPILFYPDKRIIHNIIRLQQTRPILWRESTKCRIIPHRSLPAVA